MPPQYLLPCDKCKHQVIVVPKQAGQHLKCPQCKHGVEAPMLGKMKQLEMVGGTESAKRSATSGSKLRNMLFVAGLAMAIIGGATGFFVNKAGNGMIYEIDYDLETKHFNEEVDHLSSAQVVALYDAMNIDSGLGEWYEPNFVRYNIQGKILQKISYCLFGTGLLGVLLTLGSFAVKR